MKTKQKTLPAIRITSELDSNMKQAIKKLNEKSIIEIPLQEFRRICYIFTSQKILMGEEIKLRQT